MTVRRKSKRVAVERVKLTVAEGLALIDALKTGVGTVPLAAALVTALGSAKAATLITERKGVRLTKEEIVALVKAIYPLIPGATVKDKLVWIVRMAKPAFATQERYLAVIRYVKERIKAFAAGTEPGDTPSDPGTSQTDFTLQPFGQGTIPIYMKTMYWWEDINLMKQELALCGKYRVGYGFEMMGDSAKKVMLTPALMAKVEAAYKIAVTEARRLGIWLYVVPVNDNMGKGKYGDPGIPLSKCTAGAQQLCQIIKANGPDNVIVTPAAETLSSAGIAYEKYCVQQLQGFILAYNGQGGRPTSLPSGYRIRIQHEPTVDAFFKHDHRDGLVGDHYTFIRYMQGAFDGALDPAKNAAWFAKGAALGYTLMAAYAFKRQALDAAGIASCALKSAGPVVVPAGSLLPSQVRWLGLNFKNAKVTRQLLSASIGGKHFNFKLASALGWPPQGAKKCDGIGFLIRKLGNEYVGGKVEWCVSSRGWYDIATNVAGGYNGSTMPKSGETVWGGIGHPTNTSECTTLLKVVWP